MADEQITDEAPEVEEKPEEAAAPEPITKADIEALTHKIAALEAKIAGQTEPPAEAPDEAEIDKLYAELYGPTQPGAGEPENATAKELRAVHKEVAEVRQLQSETYKAQKRAEIDAAYAKKYAEWDAWHEDLWKFASKHPTLSGDEVFTLVKAQKMGIDLAPSKETKDTKETKAAQQAVEAAKKAQRASSEKPTTGVHGKTRDTSDWNAMFEEAYGELPDKPVFK